MPTFTGTAGDDILVGTDDIDTIDGLGGNDIIRSGMGADRLSGGDGDDTFVFTNTGSGPAQPRGQIDGGAGFDTLDLTQVVVGGAALLVSGRPIQIGNQYYDVTGVERFLLGAGNDSLVLTTQTTDLRIFGGAGDDFISGGSGIDIIYGGTGNDRLEAGVGDTLYGEDGDDQLTGVASTRLDGGEGNDRITGGDDSVLIGGAGNDIITGGARSRIEGGLGDDVLSGGDLSQVHGGAGRNQLTGNGRVTLFGGDEGDLFFNIAGGTLVGGLGNDVFTVGSTRLFNDRTSGSGDIRGGGGTDTLVSGPAYMRSTVIDLQAGSYVSGDIRYTLSGIEDVTVDVGGTSNATVVGSDQANVLSAVFTALPNPAGSRFGDLPPGRWTVDGRGGDDTINGGLYATRLLGGDGNDTMSGTGTAYYDGGTGVDTVALTFSATAINVSLQDQGFYEVREGILEFRRELLSVENLTGSNFDDTIAGSDGDNILNGGAGLDTAVFRSRAADVIITYLNGQVIVTGPEGRDVLTGFEVLRFADATFDLGANGLFTQRQTIVGTTGDDTFQGGAASDVISGRAGNDTIRGFGGNDSLYGEEGNDTLFGGDGNDGLDGGDGNDRLEGEAGNDRLEGRAGNDLLLGGDGSDELNGGDGDDTLDGGAGDDLLSGGNGNDTLDGGAGNDALFGGAGDDTIIAGGGTDTIDGGDGADRYVFTGSAGRIYDLRQSTQNAVAAWGVGLVSIENLTGSSGNDFFVGNALSNDFEGGAGNDYLSGFDGNDRLSGGDGDDQLEGGLGDDVLIGGAGNDTAVYTHTFAQTSLTVENGNLVLTGLLGRDVLSGIEVLRFSDLTLTIGTNAIAGTDGADILTGTAGDDTIVAGASNDRLFGLAGNDYLDGGDGDDVIDAGSGIDFVNGGAGRDRLVLHGNGVTVDMRLDLLRANGPGPVVNGNRLTVINVEDVVGTDGNDLIIGTEVSNTIEGGLGGDLVSGAGGDDILNGGQGDDLVDGGTGFDVAVVSGLRSAFVLSVQNGQTILTGPDGRDTLRSIEAIQFSDGLYDIGSDGQIASGPRQVLTGTSGSDTLTGGGSNDSLAGGSGNDVLRGNGGSDRLDGGDGFDAAVYAGVRRQYAASSTSVAGGPERGTDTLISIEEARFVDGVLSFDVNGIPAQIMRLYDTALDRLPDQAGLDAQLRAFAIGAANLQTLAANFLGSPEFQSRYGNLSNQGFVEQLYRFSLNREGDAAGIAVHVNALNSGMPREALLVAFSESPEHRILTQPALNAGLFLPDQEALLIARLYDATFDRLPDAAGLAVQVAALDAGTSLLTIAEGFAASAEFQARYGSLTNQQFVEQLYRFCLDREGDAPGIAAQVSALNNGTSRAQMLLNFSESPEHVALTAPSYLGGIRTVDAPLASSRDMSSATKPVDAEPQVLVLEEGDSQTLITTATIGSNVDAGLVPQIQPSALIHDPADIVINFKSVDDAFVLPTRDDLMPLVLTDQFDDDAGLLVLNQKTLRPLESDIALVAPVDDASIAHQGRTLFHDGYDDGWMMR